MVAAPVILWLREDLRVADNPALVAAAGSVRRILPVFIRDDEAAGTWRPGGATRWWLHETLEALNLPLLRRQGDSAAVLDELIAATGADSVFWNRRYTPWGIGQDKAIKKRLGARGLDVRSFAARTIAEPFEIAQGGGGPYKVFTPYSRAWMKQCRPRSPLPPPAAASFLRHDLASDDLDLLPAGFDWTEPLRQSWQAGEAAAERLLQAFIEDTLTVHGSDRDLPAASGTSRLSPYLAAGAISPHRVFQVASTARPEDAFPFVRQLIWREFAYHTLFHFPHLPDRSLRQAFDGYPWSDDGKLLRAWRKGLTGYPIVDAGMRELWWTGYMHNRVRLIVGSFLTKDLLIDWRKGARWFWDTLIDADLANNSLGWQWVAGTGIDASPYFRIFNPTTQAQKFDFSGTYVRHWVPELAKLPDEWLHQPADAPAEILAAAGVVPGETYPRPVVDHAKARAAALEGYRQVKERG